MKIQLERFTDAHKEKIWKDGFFEKSPEWAKLNAPYFEDYVPFESLESFECSGIWEYLQQPNCKAIIVEGVVVGMVSQNWIDEKTRWMELSSPFNLQYFLICLVFICELVVSFSFLNRCFWISRAASTRFFICSDVSHCSSVVSSSNFTGDTSTWMSILSSIGRLTLLR